MASIPEAAVEAALTALDRSWIADASREQWGGILRDILEAAAPHMLADEAARVEQVSDIVAAVEEIILDKVGTNVLRSGYDGSFSSAGGQVARLIDAALTNPYRSQS